MFKTKSIEKAMEHANEIKERSFDLHLDTRKLKYTSNGHVSVVLPKEGEVGITDHAFTQLSRMLKVPGAWVNTKRELKDLGDLASGLNRHTKQLPSTGIFVRCIKENKKKLIRAVFPDNVALLDLPDAVKAIKVKLNKRVSAWQFIAIADYSVRAFGTIGDGDVAVEGSGDHKWLKGIIPGIHVFASDTGEYPIGGEVGIFRSVCENTAVIKGDFCVSLKRKEKEPGGLGVRFREAIDELRHMLEDDRYVATLNAIPVMGAAKCGEDRICCLQEGAKMFGYPRKVCPELDAAWDTKEQNLFGMWNAISKRGTQLSTEGNWKLGHKLQQSAGAMTRMSQAQRQQLVEASQDIPY